MQLETIKIGKGIDYAKVATRVVKFHEDNPKQASIETTIEFKDGWALTRAVVSTARGTFTGHSMAKLAGVKALEKQETIAVGRALAFAGYAASGEIASIEEMSADVDRTNREQHGDIREKAIKDILKCDNAVQLVERVKHVKKLFQNGAINKELQGELLQVAEEVAAELKSSEGSISQSEAERIRQQEIAESNA